MKKLNKNTINKVLSNRTVLFALNDLCPFSTHRDITKRVQSGHIPAPWLNVISAHLRTPSEQLLEMSDTEIFAEALRKAEQMYFKNKETSLN